MSQLTRVTFPSRPRPAVPDRPDRPSQAVVPLVTAPADRRVPGPALAPTVLDPVFPGETAPSTALLSHQLWWDRLAQQERSHTIACVGADHVDPQMLEILRCNGPVGPYGVRWVRGDATFIPGSFLDFLRACGSVDAPTPTSGPATSA